jgi:hypothetical protein
VIVVVAARTRMFVMVVRGAVGVGSRMRVGHRSIVDLR